MQSIKSEENPEFKSTKPEQDTDQDSEMVSEEKLDFSTCCFREDLKAFRDKKVIDFSDKKRRGLQPDFIIISADGKKHYAHKITITSEMSKMYHAMLETERNICSIKANASSDIVNRWLHYVLSEQILLPVAFEEIRKLMKFLFHIDSSMITHTPSAFLPLLCSALRNEGSRSRSPYVDIPTWCDLLIKVITCLIENKLDLSCLAKHYLEQIVTLSSEEKAEVHKQLEKHNNYNSFWDACLSWAKDKKMSAPVWTPMVLPYLKQLSPEDCESIATNLALNREKMRQTLLIMPNTGAAIYFKSILLSKIM